MDIKITTKNENKLLGRTEITGEIGFTAATPSYPDLKKELATNLKVTEDVIAIKNIYTTFGDTKAKFSANIYPNADALKKIEPKLKVKKTANTEEKK